MQTIINIIALAAITILFAGVQLQPLYATIIFIWMLQLIKKIEMKSKQ